LIPPNYFHISIIQELLNPLTRVFLFLRYFATVPYEISQSQYYKWRDLVLDGADRVCVPDPDKEKERMRKKINKLNQHIGELTVELKKTEELL
jgi:hypothetical protein